MPITGRTLDRMSGTAACGAAVKADGYGLGASAVAARLAAAGCRDFFVATWAEAEAIAPLGLTVSVLHGVRAEDMDVAREGRIARPVLDTPAQVSRWKAAEGGVCDVMVDTGMNRLGVSPQDVRAGLLDGLTIDTLMSHLACAEEDVAMNAHQRADFGALAGVTAARRMSLANSAGIALGPDYVFDLTRPGLALYGGVPCGAFAGTIRTVATPQAQVLQRRRVPARRDGWLQRDVDRARTDRDRDPQPWLCQRLFPRLFRSRCCAVWRRHAAGDRPGLDGPPRGRGRYRARCRGGGLAHDGPRSADRVGGQRDVAI